MSWTTTLFALRVRMNRARYWAALVIVVIGWFMLAAALGAVATAVSSASEQIMADFAGVLGVAFAVAIALSMLALCVKRLHDLSLSGWWIVAIWILSAVAYQFATYLAGLAVPGYVVPLVDFLVFVVLGVFPGTRGPNRFGDDPRPG